MFGYVKPDLPYLYIKDEILFKALYCGECRSMGKICGQRARTTLTYDIAFLSAIVHNLLGVDVEIEQKRCIIHWIVRRPMAKPDDISGTLGCLNVILAYYKIKDDIEDNGRGRLKKLFLGKAFKRAKKLCPDFEKTVRENYIRLSELEKAGCDSIDRTADPFAEMLAILSDDILKDKKSEASYNFFYNFGKWIYLIDALDDYDKDIKKKNYNPFYAAYKKNGYSLLKKECGEEIAFIMNATLDGIRTNFEKLRFSFNGDLVRNISVRGTAAMTGLILKKETGKKCRSCRKCRAENGKGNKK